MVDMTILVTDDFPNHVLLFITKLADQRWIEETCISLSYKNKTKIVYSLNI